MSNRIPLLYVLHSGNLYGTERMALATIASLPPVYDPIVAAPPGPALEAASEAGYRTHAFHGTRDLVPLFRHCLSQNRELVFFATGVSHSLLMIGLNLFYRRRIAHIHMVHGGTDERLSYGRKRRLNGFNVVLVAVSEFVRQRLLAHGVRRRQIEVLENFLTPDRVAAICQRPPFTADGVRRAVVISRIDPIKRIDVLLDAVESSPELRSLPIRILGSGSEMDSMRARAARSCPNIEFAGMIPDVSAQLAEADLLIHLCPEEPFGLAILEGFAARLPVVVPDSGGAGTLLIDGVSGYRFHANDPSSLAALLSRLMHEPAVELDRVAAAGHESLNQRFSPQRLGAQYSSLIERQLQ